jgi:hypothetical protein
MRRVRVVWLVEHPFGSLGLQGNIRILDWMNSELAWRQDKIVILNLLRRFRLVRLERQDDVFGQLLSLLAVQTDTDRLALARLDGHTERVVVAVIRDTWEDSRGKAIQSTSTCHELCNPFQSQGGLDASAPTERRRHYDHAGNRVSTQPIRRLSPVGSFVMDIGLT